MTDFTTEFVERLQSEFGAAEEDAQLIAEKAAQFRADNDRDDTPDELIERMRKRRQETAIGKWNTVVGFLDGSSWSIGDDDGGDNPYQL